MVDLITKLLVPESAQSDPVVRLGKAKVTAVDTNTVTLDWNGASGYKASWYQHQGLVVGDVVSVLHGEGVLVVQGKIR